MSVRWPCRFFMGTWQVEHYLSKRRLKKPQKPSPGSQCGQASSPAQLPHAQGCSAGEAKVVPSHPSCTG